LRYYPVPFSTEGEEKLIFNFTVKESLILGGGIFLGLIAAGLLAAVLKTYVLYCLPLVLPFAAAGAVLALMKVNKEGCEMTVADYLIHLYRYKNRARHHLRLRKEMN